MQILIFSVDAGTKRLQNSYVYYKLDRMASSKNAFYI